MAKAPVQWEMFDWLSLNPGPIIGVDEVGRGCLAGPVYAAAVILNPLKDYSGYTDSKKISGPRREVLSEQICTEHRASIGIATVEEIEKLNIFRASLLAMWRAVRGLEVVSGHVLVDGKFPIPQMTQFKQTCLIKGDLRAKPIAAASIVAKVARDLEMQEKGKEFPQYGFEVHKGYATPTHKKAIAEWGPCPLHRRLFAGVKEHLSRLS